MGLDMYLSKRTYIGSNYEHRNVEIKIDVKVGEKDVKINPKKITHIVEEAAYWRKSNHIHAWFVENCQDGVDDCRPSNVATSQIKELIEICKEVLEKRDEAFSEANLPTQPGFFFGGTEYDEWYYTDIEDTIKMLTEAIADVDEDDYNVEFEYRASW